MIERDMRRLSIYRLIILVVLVLIGSIHQNTSAQEPLHNEHPKHDNVDKDKIIRTLSNKETETQQAINSFTFRREVVIQTIGMGGQISGEYYRLSDFLLDNKNGRYEKIIRYPLPTLERISVTAEDLENISDIQAFGIEASKIDKYQFTYKGKEKIDDLNLFIFDVEPKSLPKEKRRKEPKERFFKGRIWIDDVDFQIVKVRGKIVPEGKQRYPTFETYREHVNGRYWFPSYTYTDDDIIFGDGSLVHIRSRVRYKNYEKQSFTENVGPRK
jgi:hypothetical protein